MKNNFPLISVIITTFNNQKHIKKSVNSVLSQTYKNFELIIIDDCSTDLTEKIIKKIVKKDKRIKFFKTKKNNQNPSVARNLGISISKGKYISFLDSDDYWELDFLEFQIKNINKFDLSFVASFYQKEGSLKKSNFLLNYFRILLQIFFTKKIKKKGFFWLYVYNPFLISGTLIKKNFLKNIRFNNDSFEREDLTFWLDIFKKKVSFVYHPNLLLTIVRRKKSITSNKIKEINIIINSICNNILKNKCFDKFNYLLFGIFFRISKLILLKANNIIRKFIYFALLLLSITYFVIFYSPLFWHIGDKLVVNENYKKTEAVFVLSGHEGFEYWNQSFKQRFLDIEFYINKFNAHEDTKIFLLGKLEQIPDQKILESLLINKKVNPKNIYVIYEEYKNSLNALNLLKNYLDKYSISSVTIITSPYHSYRLKYLWSKINNNKFETIFFKNINIPKKNNFFERSYNKKEIIYEILANLYAKFK